MAVFEITEIDIASVILLALGDKLSVSQRTVIQVWPPLDHSTKRGLQPVYSKFLQTQKYNNTTDSLAKKAKEIFDANI